MDVRTLIGGSAPRAVPLRLVVDADHYSLLMQQALPRARVSAWISTANVKELMVEAPVGTAARARGRYISALETLRSLTRQGVDVRLLHAAPASRPFQAELRRLQLHRGRLAMRLCPRVHLKVMAIDGALLYVGSANFTGAGLGAKGEDRRNFEMGVVTDDDLLLDQVQAKYDAIWSGRECKACKRRALCPRPLDQLER